MRQRELRFFRYLLDDRKKYLLTEAERALGTMKGEVEDACTDPNDRATLESDRAYVLRIRDRERKLLSKIDAAVARIEDGTYGLCEECGEDIGIERLKARPVTTLCIACKSAQEARERQLANR